MDVSTFVPCSLLLLCICLRSPTHRSGRQEKYVEHRQIGTEAIDKHSLTLDLLGIARLQPSVLATLFSPPARRGVSRLAERNGGKNTRAEDTYMAIVNKTKILVPITVRTSSAAVVVNVIDSTCYPREVAIRCTTSGLAVKSIFDGARLMVYFLPHSP